MARFKRLEVYNTIIDTGLVPVFYNADINVAKNVVKACTDGGATVVEFTNRGDFAPEVFKELSQHLSTQSPEVILGVGSVIDEPTAALYIAYGANFVVGPLLNEAVARLCNRRKVAYMPGCGSVSEISYAEELGMEIVKIFPGDSVGGPNFVKAVLGPAHGRELCLPVESMPLKKALKPGSGQVWHVWASAQTSSARIWSPPAAGPRSQKRCSRSWHGSRKHAKGCFLGRQRPEIWSSQKRFKSVADTLEKSLTFS